MSCKIIINMSACRQIKLCRHGAPVSYAMPTVRKRKLANCRGIRRMHLRSNVSACEQAPARQFGSDAHGSNLRAKQEKIS